MDIALNTNRTLRVIRCVLLPLLCFYLAACQPDSAEPATFSAPALLRNIPADTLSVTVVVDDQATPYQGTRRDDGSWFVNINVELNREHSATVSWYALNNGEKVIIATQTSTFFASASGMSSLGGELQTDGAPEFDMNCNGVSNFAELSQGTDPSANNECIPNESEPLPNTPDPLPSVTEPLPDDVPVPETIAIEPGCFDMGSPVTEPNRDEWETLHRVCIRQRLHVGVYEVTFNQYDYFASQPENPEPRPYNDGMESGNRPVKNIIWESATSYAAWLSSVTGDNYRLLTEAEWEYVARAGTTTAYWTGDNISKEFENINSDRIFDVGSLNQPNPWGLHDMLGNVAEWTCTSFQAEYDGVAENTCDPSGLTNKALRGAPYYFGAKQARSAARNETIPSTVDGGIGFRIVRVE